jgi:hypothetical protein
MGNRKEIKIKNTPIDFKTNLEPCLYCVWLNPEKIVESNQKKNYEQ